MPRSRTTGAVVSTDTPRVAVFFYGLFMDEGALRAQGYEPRNAQRARLKGHRLAIGSRATLVKDPSDHVHGIVMSLTHDELDELYGAGDLNTYRPEAVLLDVNGAPTAALCYVLPNGPDAVANPQYAARLRALCRALSFPDDYIHSIR